MTTQLETTFTWPAPIPGWDMLKWKDETQAAILRETEGMTDEEVREYFHQAVVRGEQRRAKLLERQKTETV